MPSESDKSASIGLVSTGIEADRHLQSGERVGRALHQRWIRELADLVEPSSSLRTENARLRRELGSYTPRLGFPTN